MDDNIVFIRDVNDFPKLGMSMSNPSKHGSTHHAVFVREVRDNINKPPPNGVCGVSKNLEARISVYQTHTYFYVSILINLWTMSIRMNGPHARTALSYTFILRPVKARKYFSSKIIFTTKLILYF